MPGKVSRTLRFYGTILKDSMAQFSARNAMTHAAAMAYYMVFSLPPILFIVIWTADRFYREALMHRALAAEIGELVGEEGARQLMATIERLNLQEPTWGATVIGVGAMIFTATTVLVTARDALNRIADAKPAGKTTGNFWTMLLSRLVSTAMLGTISIILLVSLVMETLASALTSYVAAWHQGVADVVMAFDSLLLDVGAATVLVALFFRFLPDVKLPWRDIWPGAAVTAVLFSIGQIMIGFIIGRSDTADLYGAAGSFLVIMLWVYYASALLLFGATFTFTRARLLRAA